MKVSISVDIIENMLRLHHRRGETQKCIFALLLGVIDGYNNYTIKECLYRFIYYNENYQEGSKDNAAKFSQALEDEVKPAITKFKEINPNLTVLGGITTGTDLNYDVMILREAIGNIKPSVINIKNDIFVVIDSNQMETHSNYLINAFNWKLEKTINCVSLFKINCEIDWAKTTNTLKENMMRNINNKSLKELDQARLYEINKKKIFSLNDKVDKEAIVELLSKVSEYLEREGPNIESDIYNKILWALDDVESLLSEISREECLKTMESGRLNLISSLTSILEKQIRITDKINSTYLK